MTDAEYEAAGAELTGSAEPLGADIVLKVRRPGRKPPAWQLTFKQASKTRTVYVPVDLVPEVQKWTTEFKRLKILIRKVTRQNLAIIRKHVAARRAASRARRLTPKPSAGN